ncbi:hypothetical protein [Xanthomonas sp. SHU 199]|uniref:hypothetical protein n=1 Tax=Xanthomonas sp. SHU 199 TaxID=1591174 RepID=UPI00035D909D|nr:hypothetical protein [Xanthomonas sp. SHU 199]
MAEIEQRARFEAWAESEGLIGVSHGIMSVNSQTETAWRAWQAALASQAQVPEGGNDELG